MDERWTPEVIGGSRVGQDIDPALNRYLGALIIGDMSKNRFASMVGLGDDHLGYV